MTDEEDAGAVALLRQLSLASAASGSDAGGDGGEAAPGSPGAVRQARPAPAPALLCCKHCCFGTPEPISMHVDDLLEWRAPLPRSACACGRGLVHRVCCKRRAHSGFRWPGPECFMHRLRLGNYKLHVSMTACQPVPRFAACTAPATASAAAALVSAPGRAGAPPQVHERVAHRAEPSVLQRAAGRLRARQAAAVGEGVSRARPVRHALRRLTDEQARYMHGCATRAPRPA